MAVLLRYHTDPACSASWAAEPRLRRLMVEFGAEVEITYVMGGVARELTDLPRLAMRWLDDAAAELWRLAADWRVQRAPVLTGELWEVP